MRESEGLMASESTRETSSARTRELRRRVNDVAETWKASGGRTVLSDSWGAGFEPALSKLLADEGMIGLAWPQEWGGGGGSFCDRLTVTEELIRLGLPVTAHWIADRQIGPAILRHGSDDLKRELLGPIASAEVFFCLGMSEPGAGSDLAAVSTRAVRTEGGWRVSGRKIWTSWAHRSTHIYLLVRTDPASERHRGLTEMISPLDVPGIEVTPIRSAGGRHHFNEVLLEDVFIPDRYVLGEVGNGWRQVVEQLSFERGGAERFLSAYAAFRVLVEEVRSAEGPVDDDVATRIGDLSARLAVLRHMAWNLAERLDEGQAPVMDSAALKLIGSRFEFDVVDLVRRVNGDRAVLASSTLSELLLSAPGFGIRGGAADVLLSMIAKQEVRGR